MRKKKRENKNANLFKNINSRFKLKKKINRKEINKIEKKNNKNSISNYAKINNIIFNI